ncbi:unnamed protein product [Ectocarpus sp. CCAP 1310/34]|nr:unnamed protein product [Ectocarpus sp. CCAP 1310/34]
MHLLYQTCVCSWILGDLLEAAFPAVILRNFVEWIDLWRVCVLKGRVQHKLNVPPPFYSASRKPILE